MGGRCTNPVSGASRLNHRWEAYAAIPAHIIQLSNEQPVHFSQITCYLLYYGIVIVDRPIGFHMFRDIICVLPGSAYGASALYRNPYVAIPQVYHIVLLIALTTAIMEMHELQLNLFRAICDHPRSSKISKKGVKLLSRGSFTRQMSRCYFFETRW